MRNLLEWWRKRQREKKRLKLLALVRKVREEQGDYDAYVGSKDRAASTSPAKKVDTRKRLPRKGEGRKARRRV